jgi:hypothetical protein
VTVVLCFRPREGANLVLSRAPLLEPVARLVGMHDVQSDSVGLLKQVMVMLLLQSAIHHRSRMRLYYWLRPRTHRAVRTAEEAGCELRPSPLVEGAVPAPGRSSKGGGALEFELPKTAETANRVVLSLATNVCFKAPASTRVLRLLFLYFQWR